MLKALLLTASARRWLTTVALSCHRETTDLRTACGEHMALEKVMVCWPQTCCFEAWQGAGQWWNVICISFKTGKCIRKIRSAPATCQHGFTGVNASYCANISFKLRSDTMKTGCLGIKVMSFWCFGVLEFCPSLAWYRFSALEEFLVVFDVFFI